MKLKKGQYINLVDGSVSSADPADVKFSLDTQVVQMGGKTWGWVWNRPRGIILRKGKEQRRVPIIDFTRWAQTVLYGISVLLVAIGVIKKFSSNGGEVNGG
jgi:hypothetical protein